MSLISIDHTCGTDDLLGQKLTFQCFKNIRDVPYYSTNIKKECDIFDQHTLSYRCVKTMNENMTNKNCLECRGLLQAQKIDLL